MRRFKHCRLSTLSSISASTQRVPDHLPCCGRGVKFQLSRFAGRKGGLQRGARVGIEIIQHHPTLLRVRKLHIYERLHVGRPVLLGTPIRHTHIAPPRHRRERHKQMLCAIAVLFAVGPGHMARPTGP